MGIRRSAKAFRPAVEGVESRELAAGGLAGLAAHPAGPHTMKPAIHSEIGPGLGHGLVRLTMPYNFQNYGVVSIWNNTYTRVTFLASASTYQNGTPYSFTLFPGQVRSFYAQELNGFLPTFEVSFGRGAPWTVLPLENKVFDGPGYVPNGTAGWPYAINIGVNGYYISYV